MKNAKEDLPTPSNHENAVLLAKKDTETIDFSKGILTYVDVDFAEYRRKLDSKAVRKNVTIPSWLNYEAEQAGINVSRVLQEALIDRLNLQRKF